MIELWRGNANAWECDELGHMNVRFYLAKASEAVANLAAEAGLPDAFRARATATFIPRDIHIRFLAEARPGAPLAISGGFTRIGDDDAGLILVMRHAARGDVAATVRIRAAHAHPRDGRAFPWPQRFHARAEALMVDAPDFALPRGVEETAPDPGPSLARADEMGLARIGLGRFGAADMDVFGRMRAEFLLGRVSDSVVNFAAAFPEESEAHADDGALKRASALLECRIVPRRWPQAGDGYVIRSGLSGSKGKIRNLVHWVLDPATGRPWWTMEGVAGMMDLDARKLVAPDPATQAGFDKAIVSELAV